MKTIKRKNPRYRGYAKPVQTVLPFYAGAPAPFAPGEPARSFAVTPGTLERLRREYEEALLDFEYNESYSRSYRVRKYYFDALRECKRAYLTAWRSMRVATA